MGKVADLQAHRASRQAPTGARSVTCAQCGERHAIVRLAGGSMRCPTAFPDADRWFCRNRGCRAAWAASHTQGN
jgi:hypothetical protein